MYVATVPNRNSPPAILFRESFRENGKVKSRTIANISHLRSQQIEALRLALAGSLPTSALLCLILFRSPARSLTAMRSPSSVACVICNSTRFSTLPPAVNAIWSSP